MTCATYVADAGKAWRGQLGIASDAHLPGLARLAGDLRAAGTVSSVGRLRLRLSRLTAWILASAVMGVRVLRSYA